MRNMVVLTMACLVLVSSCVYAQVEGCTSRESFDAATAGYVQHTVVDFDNQAAGTSAAKYDGMSCAAEGLDSSGSILTKIGTVATNNYPVSSSPNGMGNSMDDGQFLAGNGDKVTFKFSEPVHAFGMYLIGNPSPTGDPAIPFWRLNVNIGRYTAVFSDTVPLYNLGPGNDVYFLGIVSRDTGFTEAVLCSDNDRAACYSFNMDDVVYAALPNKVSILEAKEMESGPVRVTAVVSRAHGDRFNIQQDNPLAGIAVMGTGTARGRLVTVLGNVSINPEHEKIIELEQILGQTDSTPPRSLGMNTLSVGGASMVGLQAGVPGSVGPNNIGLDATVCGRVTAIDTEQGEWITIDDGAGRDLIWGIKGIVVLGAVNTRQRYVGEFVTVRGSMSVVELEPGRLGPAIRVADISDITP